MFSRTLCRILIFPTFPYFVEIHLHKNIFLNKFMNSRRSFFFKYIYNIWMDTSLWIIFWCELCWKQEHFSFCWAIEEVFEHTLFLLLIWKILVKLVCVCHLVFNPIMKLSRIKVCILIIILKQGILKQIDGIANKFWFSKGHFKSKIYRYQRIMQVIEMEVLFFAKSYISTLWQRNLKKNT